LIVQHIILSMVRKSLVAINEGIIHEGLKIWEHVKSTILHLEVIEAFLEVFNGQRKSLE
jgi:hypothetical protein